MGKEVVIRGHHLEHLINTRAMARAYNKLSSRIPPSIKELIEDEYKEYENCIQMLGIKSYEDKVKVVAGIPDGICKNCQSEPSCFGEEATSFDVEVAEKHGVKIGKLYSFKYFERNYIDKEAEKLIPREEKTLHNLVELLKAFNQNPKILERILSETHL